MFDPDYPHSQRWIRNQSQLLEPQVGTYCFFSVWETPVSQPLSRIWFLFWSFWKTHVHIITMGSSQPQNAFQIEWKPLSSKQAIWYILPSYPEDQVLPSLRKSLDGSELPIKLLCPYAYMQKSLFTPSSIHQRRVMTRLTTYSEILWGVCPLLMAHLSGAVWGVCDQTVIC